MPSETGSTFDPEDVNRVLDETTVLLRRGEESVSADRRGDFGARRADGVVVTDMRVASVGVRPETAASKADALRRVLCGWPGDGPLGMTHRQAGRVLGNHRAGVRLFAVGAHLGWWDLDVPDSGAPGNDVTAVPAGTNGRTVPDGLGGGRRTA